MGCERIFRQVGGFLRRFLLDPMTSTGFQTTDSILYSVVREITASVASAIGVSTRLPTVQ